jgi:hypothetical protein
LKLEKWTQDEIDALTLAELVDIGTILMVRYGIRVPVPPTLPEEEILQLVLAYGG